MSFNYWHCDIKPAERAAAQAALDAIDHSAAAQAIIEDASLATLCDALAAGRWAALEAAGRRGDFVAANAQAAADRLALQSNLSDRQKEAALRWLERVCGVRPPPGSVVARHSPQTDLAGLVYYGNWLEASVKANHMAQRRSVFENDFENEYNKVLYYSVRPPAIKRPQTPAAQRDCDGDADACAWLRTYCRLDASGRAQPA